MLWIGGGESMSLPEDVVGKILLKLPSLKSVAKFGCVCKSWRDMIKDPHFRDELSNRFDNCCTNDPYMVFYKDPSNRYYQIRTHSSNYFGRVNFSYGIYGIVGSCNGIVCLQQLSSCKSKYNIHLYNPITREHRNLPPSKTPHWVHQGFGFDRSSNDYKVISIHGRNKAEVYKLSTNCWSDVNLDLGFSICPEFLTPCCVYVNGYCHWRGCDGKILIFDIQNETFSIINLPEHTRHCYHGLGEWDNSVALCIFQTEMSETMIEVWIMSESSSWIKKFCLKSVDLVSCWVHDANLFQLKSNGEVITLPVSEEEDREHFKTGSFSYDWPHLRSILFKPSLVSLRSGSFMPAVNY